MNISFAGCGFLGIYHVGVASCLREHAPHLIDESKVAGASAGAIAAVCLLTGCPLGACTSYVLKIATKARSRALGPLHPSFNIVKIIKDGLRDILPDNAHEIVSGRVFVSMTRVSDRQCVIVSEFESKEDLIQALVCSAHIPLYSGLIPPAYKGTRYVDGCLTDNLPQLWDDTVTVSPFAGESDICPRDNDPNLVSINLANTSMQFTARNMYRMSRALFPPHPEQLSEMCKQGFDDALKYLQQHNLISCTRHISIKSSIASFSSETAVYSEDSSSTSDYDSDHEYEDGHHECHECKNRVHRALVDSLPHPVISAFQAASDSIDSGILGKIYKMRTYKAIALLTSPLLLPADIAYNFGLRFLEWVPYLPSDVQWAIGELIHQIKALLHLIEHHRHRYSARFTCQLAIHDVDEDAVFMPTTHTQTKTFTTTTRVHNLSATLTNKLTGKTKKKPSLKIRDASPAPLINQLRHQLEEEETKSIQTHIHTPNTSFHGEIKHTHAKEKEMVCDQLVDTFEHCLHEANQREAVLAWYYTDKKGNVKVTEIFTCSNEDNENTLRASNESLIADLQPPQSAPEQTVLHSTPCEQRDRSVSNASSVNPGELSWDNYLEVKHEPTEEDLDESIFYLQPDDVDIPEITISSDIDSNPVCFSPPPLSDGDPEIPEILTARDESVNQHKLLEMELSLDD